MAKKQIKKDVGKTISATTPTGTYNFEANVNVKLLSELFQKWVDETDKVSGAEIGMHQETSLYTMFLRQGVTGRTKGMAGAESNAGGNVINNMLIRIFNNDIDVDDISDLKQLRQYMANINSGENPSNPRSIPFTDKEIDEETGEITNRQPVWGHFRTPNYEELINYKIANRKPNAPQLKPSPAVKNTQWYSFADGNTAKPPFWSMLYAENPNDIIGYTLTNSLIQIIDAGIEALEQPLGLSKDTPIQLGDKTQRGWAKKAMQISGVKRIIKKWMDEPQPNGNFQWERCQMEIEGKAIQIPRGRDSDRIKEMIGINIPNEIKSAWFKISRWRINEIVTILLDNKRMRWENKNKRKFNTIQIANFPVEETTVPDGSEQMVQDEFVQTNKSINSNLNDWRDILKREIIC